MSSPTDRRAALLLPLILCARPASALDWNAFVTASDRSLNPIIISALETTDHAGDGGGEELETSLSICSALGKRNDPFAGDIISALGSGFSRSGNARTELLLRLLLDSLFKPSLGEAVIQGRVAANAESLIELASRLRTFKDPQLKGSILRLLPFLDWNHGLSTLLETGAILQEKLGANRGVLSPQETGLLLDFLASAERMPAADLLEPCLGIARLSREEPVVRRARDAARAILLRRGPDGAMKGRSLEDPAQMK